MSSIRSNLIRPFLHISVKNLFRPSVPVTTQRKLLDLASVLMPPAKSVQVEKIDIDGIPCEWVQDPGSTEKGIMLYLHGGGYNIGSCASHRLFAATLSRACKIPLLVVDYRLAPEYKFPAPLDDVIVAYEWLLEQGYPSDEIILAGDSAGGGLALACAMVLRDEEYPCPKALVCLSPWADLQQTGTSMRENAKRDPMLSQAALQRWANNYLDIDDSPANALISPVGGDFEDLPPLLIQVGSDEVLLSDAQSVAQQAQLAGVETELQIWPNMWHDWQLLEKLLPESRQAIAKIALFVQTQLQRSSPPSAYGHETYDGA